MPKRSSEKGLGRGLGALFGEDAVKDSEAVSSLLPIVKIEPNENQPRRSFDEDSLAELTESIRLHGVLQPIIVRKMENGYFQIISGERRWRAARQAGLYEIPVMILNADDRKCLELGLIENLQREDLNPIEEAEGFRTLLEEYHLTQEEIAEQVGKSRPAIANALRLLSLPEEIRNMVAEGTLSSGHARALLSLERSQQLELAHRIAEEGLSVRKTESLVKQLQRRKQEKEPAEDPNRIYYEQAETNLSNYLGRRVRIFSGKKKGRLELEYYGTDDLNDLLDALQTIDFQKKEFNP